MFQREVAERIVADERAAHTAGSPCSPVAHRSARILFDVPTAAFMPPPKVISSVVLLTPRPDPCPPGQGARGLTGAAFGQRRKMLRQSLKSLTPDAGALLAEAAIPETARAEEVPVAGYARLANAFDLSRTGHGNYTFPFEGAGNVRFSVVASGAGARPRSRGRGGPGDAAGGASLERKRGERGARLLPREAGGFARKAGKARAGTAVSRSDAPRARRSWSLAPRFGASRPPAMTGGFGALSAFARTRQRCRPTSRRLISAPLCRAG